MNINVVKHCSISCMELRQFWQKKTLERNDYFVNPLEIVLTIQAISKSDSFIFQPAEVENGIDANKGDFAQPASNYKKKASPCRGEQDGLLLKSRLFTESKSSLAQTRLGFSAL